MRHTQPSWTCPQWTHTQLSSTCPEEHIHSLHGHVLGDTYTAFMTCPGSWVDTYTTFMDMSCGTHTQPLWTCPQWTHTQPSWHVLDGHINNLRGHVLAGHTHSPHGHFLGGTQTQPSWTFSRRHMPSKRRWTFEALTTWHTICYCVSIGAIIQTSWNGKQ